MYVGMLRLSVEQLYTTGFLFLELFLWKTFPEPYFSKPNLQFSEEKPYRLKCFQDVCHRANYLTSVSSPMSCSFNHMLEILQNDCKKKNLTVCQVVSAVIAFDLSGVPRPNNTPQHHQVMRVRFLT